MNEFEFLSPQESERPYTISELNDGIAQKLGSGNVVVWVEGEISNWKPSSSGHCYFRLKDLESQVPCVIWRSTVQQLQFDPSDGVAVMAIATIRVYQRGGYYQLDVHRMQPLGSGALYIAFERLKEKLRKEGLFDQGHKKPLPDSICTLGIVTSKRGAAIKDIIRVVASRAPQTDIIFVDVAVQGDRAAGEIASAIKLLNDHARVDCIIIGRGGGSIEDLWAFNEEIVARAIYQSAIPVISAVGHEIDFTISDYVADVRAPTPSAAAEIAVGDNQENRRYLTSCNERFANGIRRYFDDIRFRFESAANPRSFRKPLRMLMEASQHRDELDELCRKNFAIALQQSRNRLSVTCSKLSALNPLAVLARGYSVVTHEDGRAVRSSKWWGHRYRCVFLKGLHEAQSLRLMTRLPAVSLFDRI